MLPSCPWRRAGPQRVRKIRFNTRCFDGRSIYDSRNGVADRLKSAWISEAGQLTACSRSGTKPGWAANIFSSLLVRQETNYHSCIPFWDKAPVVLFQSRRRRWPRGEETCQRSVQAESIRGRSPRFARGPQPVNTASLCLKFGAGTPYEVRVDRQQNGDRGCRGDPHPLEYSCEVLHRPCPSYPE